MARKLNGTGKAAVPAAAIAAVIVAVLGKNAHGLSGTQISQYVAAVLAGASAILHADTIKRAAQKVKPRRKPIAHAGTVAMFDSVDVGQIPSDAAAVAGYVGGHWPTFWQLTRLFRGKAHLFSIAVNAGEDAACLDVENGDATPDQAVGWVLRQLKRRRYKPCIYASLSVMPTVWAKLRAAGIHRDDIRLWVADWTYQPHIPAGYDACQWTDRAYGRNLDESLCHAGFFP